VININRKEAFEILGLKQGAKKDEVKSTYRSLVKKYHADKVLHIEDESLRKSAKELFEEKMRKINEAYEILTSGSSSSSSSSSHSSTHYSQTHTTPGEEVFSQEEEDLERIHTMYYQQKESDLFSQSFESFKRDRGEQVYSEQQFTEDAPVGQIIDIVDDINPAMPFAPPPVVRKAEKKEKKIVPTDTKKENIKWKILVSFIMFVYLSNWLSAGAIYLFGGNEEPELYQFLKVLVLFIPFIGLMLITYTFSDKIKLPSLMWGKPLHFVFCWFLVFIFIVLSFAITVFIQKGNFEKSLKVLIPSFEITDETIEELGLSISKDTLEALKLLKGQDLSREDLEKHLKTLNLSQRNTEIVLTYSINGNLNKDFETPQRQFIAYFFLAGTFCLICSTILALGTEYAWRGFFLEHLSLLGKKKAAIITGFLWGLSYIPFVLIGEFTSGRAFFWEPWTGNKPWYVFIDHYYGTHIPAGILMKILFCVLMGFLLAWLYFISKNILLSCFALGVFQQFTPLGYIFIRDFDPLFCGPEGITGLAVLLIICLLVGFLARWDKLGFIFLKEKN